MKSRLPDWEDRLRAVTTADHAFVWASAGTGKTHTLTLRALYLLLSAPFLARRRQLGHDFPEVEGLYRGRSRRERLRGARSAIHSVILTTFTRKAAAEMRSRLLGYLERLASAGSLEGLHTRLRARPDPLFLEVIEGVLNDLREERDGSATTPFERLRAGARALVELAGEFEISTLHSLAASLLRRHPLESGLGATARFAGEEEDLEGLEEELVELWWRRVVLAERELQQDLRRLLEVVPLSTVRSWLAACYRHRWIPAEVARLRGAASVPAEEILGVLTSLAERLVLERRARLLRTGETLLKMVERIRAQEAGAWTELCRFIRAQHDYLFLAGKPNGAMRQAISQLETEHQSLFQHWTDLYRPLLQTCIRREYAREWDLWERFLQRFVQWVQETGAAGLGVVTFDEMIRLAGELLERHPRIRAIEQRRLLALLVDEFQDTDPEQLDLIRALLRVDAETPHEVLGFFVGDPKQSIYRFRGADVPATLDFADHYREQIGARLPVDSAQLSTSFRSLQPVTSFVNRFFEERLPLCQPQERLEAFREEEGSLPQWIVIDQEEEAPLRAGRARQLAALETVARIRQYLDGKDGSTARYSDILVLVRNGRELGALVPVLQEAGIPVVSSGARTFHRHAEVLDLLNLLIALWNPLDRLATAALLRSPLIGLSDPEVHRLLEAVPCERLLHTPAPLPGFLPSVARARLEALRSLARDRRALPLEEWLLRVRAFFPIALYREPADEEGRPRARLDRIFRDLAAEVEAGLRAPLVWLLRQREKAEGVDRWELEGDEDVSVADESVNAVRVLTVHKAKGLESPWVIVYGWSSILGDTAGGRRRAAPPVLRLSTGEGKRIQAFALAWGPLEVLSLDYPEGIREERKGAAEEAMRLAYVAATRGRDRLSLILPLYPGCPLPPGLREWIDSSLESLGERISTLICDGSAEMVRPAGPAVGQPEARRPAAPPDLEAYIGLWEERQAVQRRWAGRRLLDHPSRHGPGEEALWQGRGPGPEVGRLVHGYLERYLERPEFSAERLAALADASQQEALREAEAVLRAFWEGERARPYRERLAGGRILARELPLFLEFEKRRWQGVVDLVLEESQGLVVVDYKTMRPLEPLPASYLCQQRVYREAVARLFPGRPVDFEFWWLGL